MYILEHPIWVLLSFLIFYFFLILSVSFCLLVFRSFFTSFCVLISLLLLQLFHLSAALPSLLIEYSDSSLPLSFRFIAFPFAVHVTFSIPSPCSLLFFFSFFFIYSVVFYSWLLCTTIFFSSLVFFHLFNHTYYFFFVSTP